MSPGKIRDITALMRVTRATMCHAGNPSTTVGPQELTGSHDPSGHRYRRARAAARAPR